MTARAWLLTSAFSWNLAFGASQLMVPLYAYHLGFSGVAIGSLVSLPAIMQIFLRFGGGAAADRWGPKSLLTITYAVTVFAGPAFYFADSYLTLLLAQAILMVSGAVFWIAVQSAIIRLPGERHILLGQVTATNYIGQIVGTASSGLLVMLYGFQICFLGFSVAGLIATFCALLLPPMPGTGKGTDTNAIARYVHLLRKRPLYFAIVCSFFGAVPLTLGQSFLPVLLADIGFGEGMIGFLNALRPIGAVAAGLFLARLVTRERRLVTVRMGVLIESVAIILIPFFSHALAFALLLLALAATACMLELTYQMIAAEMGEGVGITSAMALGGIGWTTCYFIVPILIGGLADLFDLQLAFAIVGGILLLFFFVVPYFYHWTQQIPIASATHPSPGV